MSELQARELLEIALVNVTKVAVATGLDGLKLQAQSHKGVNSSQSTRGIAIDTIGYLNSIIERMV